MNAKTSTNLKNAAQAVLDGKTFDSLEGDSLNTTDRWLLEAWASPSLDKTLEALMQVLEVEPENELAQSGMRWAEGVADLAQNVLDSEEVCDVTACEETEAVCEEATCEETACETTACETEGEEAGCSDCDGDCQCEVVACEEEEVVACEEKSCTETVCFDLEDLSLIHI